MDGAPLWPVLAPGKRYAALFPERIRQPANAELSSLKPFGFSDTVLEAWAGTLSELNTLQINAINDYGLLDGNNIVVTAPTSSGKTMIGELAALQSALQRRRSIFLLPMRALVNDKFEQFTRVYEPAGLRTIRATGEHSDDVPALLRGQFDIALLTYETFSNMALGNPHVLDLAATVVVDEAQTLTDHSRGSNLEFVLTMLNNRRGRTGFPQIITLSAVVGDMRGLERWLGGRRLHSDARPVPLIEGVIDHSGALRYLNEQSEEETESAFVQPLMHDGSRRLLIPLVRRLMVECKKVVVFRQSRSESVACAGYLSQALGLPPAEHALKQTGQGDISTSTRSLQQTLGGGVAFHNTDLDRDERRVLEIEEEFRDPTRRSGSSSRRRYSRWASTHRRRWRVARDAPSSAHAGVASLTPLRDVRRVQALAAQQCATVGRTDRQAVVLVEDVGLVLGGEGSPPRPGRRVGLVHHAIMGAREQRCSRHGHRCRCSGLAF